MCLPGEQAIEHQMNHAVKKGEVCLHLRRHILFWNPAHRTNPEVAIIARNMKDLDRFLKIRMGQRGLHVGKDLVEHPRGCVHKLIHHLICSFL